MILLFYFLLAKVIRHQTDRGEIETAPNLDTVNDISKNVFSYAKQNKKTILRLTFATA